MKRLIILLLILLLAAPAAGAPQANFRCQRVNGSKGKADPVYTIAALRREFKQTLPIPVGEKLEFEVKLSRFPLYASVGKVTFEFLGPAANPPALNLASGFEAKEEDRLLQLRAEAISQGFLIRLFNLDVSNSYETLVDAHDFGARLSIKEADEGKRHTKQMALFDRAKQSVKFTDQDLSKPQESAQEKEFTIPDGALDLLSAFYFVRLQKLKEGEMLRFPVSANATNYQFEIEVQKREKLKLDLGKFRTVKLKPKLFGPGQIFSRSGEMFMWVTDDDRHMPVRLTAKTPTGTITATLVKVERPKDEAKNKKKKIETAKNTGSTK